MGCKVHPTHPHTQALSTLPMGSSGLWEAVHHVYTDAPRRNIVRAMYTGKPSKRLIFPVPSSSDRQLGRLRSGEGRLRGTTAGPRRQQLSFQIHTLLFCRVGVALLDLTGGQPWITQVRIKRKACG